jgi:ATP-binding cassette subfamily F protein uup
LAAIGSVAVNVDGLEISFGEQLILDKAEITIHEGEAVGLVGRNGCGKSTFLKILAGEEKADSGNLSFKRGIRVGYLSQEFTLDEDLTVYQNISKGAEYIHELLNKYENQSLHTSADFFEIENEIQRLNAWDLETDIKKLITVLKTPNKDSMITNLSGGEKRRVALAKALIAKPDLLILDEPTNHLDTDSIEWLEGYLTNYSGACIFVTHDRYFLDRICSRIVELNRGKLKGYKGNYSDYLVSKAEEAEVEEVLEHKRQRFLKKEVEWIRRSPKARTTKSQSRIDRYNDTLAQGAMEKEADVDLIIPPAERLGNRIVELNDIALSYGDKKLFEGFSFEFMAGNKIGIVGSNGVGKSSLIKIIFDKLAPTEGSVYISDNTVFNYIDQERIMLDDEKTVVEEVGEGYDYVQLGEERISIWGYLKRFLFVDERIKTKVGRLSGGERARLLLAKSLKQGGNFLVLDEPTNDLDLQTLRLLEEALVAFDGIVLVVSHDRYFLNRVCNGIFSFENGNVNYQLGNYDYYMSKKNTSDDSAANKTLSTEKKKVKVKDSVKKVRKLKWKEERELEGIEQEILEFEDKISLLEAEFNSPDFFKQAADLIAKKQAEFNDLQGVVEKKYARWEELEAIKSGTVEE